MLWDHYPICGPSFTETSLCSAWPCLRPNVTL